MKNRFTLIAFITSAFLAFESKAQITLTSSNFPQLQTYNLLDGMNITSFPFGNPPVTWDFGSVVMPYNSTITYTNATNPFFANDCDVFTTASRTLFGAVYNLENYWTTNSDYFGENGWRNLGATSSLATYTGGADDFVEIPAQNQLFDEARVVLNFPATYGYSNHSDSRRITNFNLSIAAYGFDNTPGQLVTHLHRYDSIVSYGKMRVYTSNGPSIYYDVLAMKSWQYELDSFYLNNAPADPSLLSAFGLSQGANDDGDKNNRLYFYRENNAAPLLLMTFGSAPFDMYNGIYVHADNISVAGTEELTNADYRTYIYPNPSNGSETTIQFLGKNVDQVHYTVKNLNGQIIMEVKNSAVTDNKLQLQFGDQIQSGTYFVEVSEDQTIIAREEIQILK